MSKLHTYKYNDDLFAKMTTIPGATNHGMVMYVDWSGSMADNMSFTLKQLYNLIWFCNRTKIPFQVLGFTDRDHRRSHDSDKDRPVVQDVVLGDACIEETKLIEWFSSNMTKLEQEKMRTPFSGRGEDHRVRYRIKSLYRSAIKDDRYYKLNPPYFVGNRKELMLGSNDSRKGQFGKDDKKGKE